MIKYKGKERMVFLEGYGQGYVDGVRFRPRCPTAEVKVSLGICPQGAAWAATCAYGIRTLVPAKGGKPNALNK